MIQIAVNRDHYSYADLKSQIQLKKKRSIKKEVSFGNKVKTVDRE